MYGQKDVFGFWRRITGKTSQDQEEISRIQAKLEFIQKQRQEKFRLFEQDRQNRLEMLKKQQEHEKSSEKILANDVKLSPAEIEKNQIRANLERQKQSRELQQNKTVNLDRS